MFIVRTKLVKKLTVQECFSFFLQNTVASFKVVSANKYKAQQELDAFKAKK